MTSLESISSKLAPLGIYNLHEESNIYFELAAYCEALDEHRKNIDEVLRECFISSAESFGLDNRERVIGGLRTEYSTEDRRKMLVLRKSLGEKDFTLEGFEKFLESIGVYDYIIEEIYEFEELVVNISGSYTPADEAWIVNQINLMAPAHLICDVYLSGRSWNVLDGQNRTFMRIDDYNYTWTKFSSIS